MSRADDPRKVAFEVLHAVSRTDAYGNLALAAALRRAAPDRRDAALATELTYGTLRYRGTLDEIIARASGREMSSLDSSVADVLRLGAYQLLLTRIASHAAVDTSVNLAREVAGRKVAGLVNAVLRKVAAGDFDSWIRKLAASDDVLDVRALRHAHPRWIARRLCEALGGEAELDEALASDNQAPPVHLCARPGLIDRQRLADESAGTAGPWSPYAVHMSGGDPAAVAAVRDGRAHVQDEGSQLTATLLAEATVDGPDERWLDLCAGPGGKAALLGSLAAQRGARLTAVEVAAHRARLVESACHGLPVEVVNTDGRRYGEPSTFDRVLLDAPCSGLGALRRRPEARWRRRESDLADLTRLQAELLESALRLVRPGGVVAYVTCSPVLDETIGIIAGVEATSRDVRPLLPGIPALGEGPAVQLWPHRHDTDAMFCALLQKD